MNPKANVEVFLFEGRQRALQIFSLKCLLQLILLPKC